MNEARTAYYGALTAFSLVGTAIAEALGGWDGALKALVCIMAVDYITGVVCALIWHKSPKSADGTFESKASIKGLFRKARFCSSCWSPTRWTCSRARRALRARRLFSFSAQMTA